jgi:beta-glucosidase
VDERTLREIYLPAFEAAVREGQPWTVMCSYNRINGVYASQNNHLLNEILRDEWGFDGVVVSDWGANHTITESVIGGLDIEMPGPARYYGDLLLQAVRIWQIDEATIDKAVRRILRMLVRSGKLDDTTSLPPGSVNTPEHQALARELAEESIVLLKNERDVLPISPDRVRSIAVIGPNATEARIGGGGSSYLEPPYRVSPLQGLQARLGQDVKIAYEQGCDNWAQVPALRSECLTPARGDGHGLWGEYYGDTKLSGQVGATRVDSKLDFWWIRPPGAISSSQFSVRWTGHLTVSDTGRHILQLVNTGICRLYLDGSLVVETRPDPQAPPEWPGTTEMAYVELIGGREHDLRVEYVKPRDVDRAVLHVRSAFAPDPDERLARAVELARTSDIAVVFAGMAQGFESEGADRPHMELPGAQDELIRAVARANENTIVVLNCGAPVEMPWIDDVSAAVLAFYPGQEGGNAIARILLGEVNPSGRLSVTYPRRYEDNPTFINYPGGRQVCYGEGIFVGYRYYDQKDIAPLFPFGFGLSYTRFAYSDLQVPATAKVGEPIEVSVMVKNTGRRAGKEVVQLYVHDHASSLVRPPKELKGFAKVSLEPGENTVVRLALDQRAFSFYDPDQGRWTTEPGTFEILVGSSSREIQATASIALV